MSAAEYRAAAARLRAAAERDLVLPESREQLCWLATIYETLAKATETLQRYPLLA